MILLFGKIFDTCGTVTLNICVKRCEFLLFCECIYIYMYIIVNDTGSNIYSTVATLINASAPFSEAVYPTLSKNIWLYLFLTKYSRPHYVCNLHDVIHQRFVQFAKPIYFPTGSYTPNETALLFSQVFPQLPFFF